MRAAICAVVLAVLPMSASAGDVVGTPINRGNGVDSCGTWSKNHEHPDDWGALSEDAWVTGFITASDTTLGMTMAFGGGVDNNALFSWISQYCAAHSLDSVEVASSALVFELERRAFIEGAHNAH